jgi:hypothetical protein
MVSMAGGTALADIFVNGQRVLAVEPTVLEGCTVEFDAAGDVFVSAPGYDVRLPDDDMVSGDDSCATIETCKGAFLVVVGRAHGGAAPYYKFEVSLNGSVVARFETTDLEVDIPLAPYVRKGKNVVRVVSTRTAEAAPDGRAGHWYEILLGHAHRSSDRPVMDSVHATLRRSASETRDFVDTYEFTAE